jgi:hypothetical protein
MLGMQHKTIYSTIVNSIMPLSRCVVQDCSNTSDKNAGRSLHKSPNDESLRSISVTFVQTKHANFYPSSREIRVVICSDHFSTDCFERLFRLHGLQRQLKPGSVPTIWRIAPAQLTRRSRRKV